MSIVDMALAIVLAILGFNIGIVVGIAVSTLREVRRHRRSAQEYEPYD